MARSLRTFFLLFLATLFCVGATPSAAAAAKAADNTTWRIRFLEAAVVEGDTVRLRAENKGKVLHEIVLGTKAELDQHAQMMQKFPGMEHDAPYMAHVRAGQRGDIVWHFNRPGTFDFACLIPGHYEAGMTGTITVRPRSR